MGSVFGKSEDKPVEGSQAVATTSATTAPAPTAEMAS
jgi:hypothetical protein